MRLRGHTKSRREERRAGEAMPPEVAALLAQRDVAAAGRLQEMAEGFDRTLAKAARRALYTLRQAGIEPPAAEIKPSMVTPVADVAQRALMSNPGGTGSKMLMFLRDDPYGGSPFVISFLVNEEEGLLDVFGRKMPRRELNDFFERLRSKESDVLVDVPADYARYALQAAVRRNVESRYPIPAGYSDWMRHVGPPEREYLRSPVYDHMDAEAVRKDLSISRDLDRFFERPVFQGWFLDIETVRPWADKFAESQQSRLVLDPFHFRQRGERVIEEAADALLAGSGIANYRRRLEDSALVLHLSGREEEAKEALYQALTLADDRPPHTLPFALALVRRSISVIFAMEAEEEEQREEEPSLIERI